MSHFTQTVSGTLTDVELEIPAGVGVLASLFKVLKEVALATPLALFINGMRTRG
jgi:hypothetical protein